MGERLWQEIQDAGGDKRIPRSIQLIVDSPEVLKIFETNLLKNGEPEAAHGEFETSYKHCIDSARVAEAGCEELNIGGEERRILVTSALLHDIGKVKVPLDILIKRRPLTAAEYQIVEQHALAGWAECQKIGETLANDLPARAEEMKHTIAEIVFRHHAWGKGRTYPSKEQFHVNPHAETERQISDLSQAVSVIDIYDSLRSERAYKEPFEAAVVRRILIGKFPAKAYPDLQRLINFLTAQK
jgi:putative nucleotidyltransferase with HDIG domain